MSNWIASIVRDVDTYFFTLGAQEAVVLGLLTVALVSLCAAFVLVRRRLHGATLHAEPASVETCREATPAAADLAAAQAELRELVREFSALAAQVLRTADRYQALPQRPEAGGAALQLLDLGLSPAEAARATGMTMGEVALLMNLRKARASMLHLPAMASVGADGPTENMSRGHDTSDGGSAEENGNGRQVGC
ncbi:MAG: hypothetical protein C3F12_12060 [Candidatus Methylomirabilota bacterium]|nr:MAG: hypothetical protein C3F12_12060 [candidate division NC10 bacterium]